MTDKTLTEQLQRLAGIFLLIPWLSVVLAVRIIGGRQPAARLLGIILEPDDRAALRK